MGSSGGGSFSDYSQRSSIGTGGGASGRDKCGEAFTSTLEEVSRCFYFITKSYVPPVETEVTLEFNGSRLIIETLLGEEIGYLPTRLNYLKICIDSGMRYKGRVTVSVLTPIPGVTVDLTPL